MEPRSSWAILAGSIAVALVAVFGQGDVADYVVLGWAVLTTWLLFRASRRHSGVTRKFMNGIVLSAVLMCAGFVVRGIHGEMVGIESPIPSPADLLHIPAYLLFLRSALLVHRERSPRPNFDAWLDAGAVVTALAMALWVGFFGDYVLSDIVAADTRIVNGVYNLIILVTFTVFVRITATPGFRPPVYYILGSAGFAFFIVDLAASYSLVRDQGLWLTIALSPIVFGLLVIALRHPTATDLLKKDLDAEAAIGPLRLSIISAAIIAPLVVVVFGREESNLSLMFLSAGALALTVLVIARVVRLLTQQRDTALLDRTLAAELTSLASLESKDAVIHELPAAAGRLLSNQVEVGYITSGSNRLAVPLPSSLKSPDRAALELAGHETMLTPTQSRVVQTLVRDAGLLVDSIDGLEAQARQASEAEANLRIAASERRFRSLVERSTDMIVVLTADSNIDYISESVQQILGHEPGALTGTPITPLLHPGDLGTFTSAVDIALTHPDSQTWHEVRFVAHDGTTRLVRFVLTNMCDVAEIEGLVLNATDVTEKRRLERDLLDAKVVDRLTLLPNRLGFVEELELSIRRTDITGGPLAVATINIRNFKAINDALGPTAADQVIVQCGSLIRKSARVDDVVGRLGGDEFVVLMRDARTAADAVASAERILTMLAEPMTIESQEIRLQADAGVVFENETDGEALDLLRDADIALTAAKQSDPGTVVLFEKEMALVATERLELRSGLARGLRGGEFRLVYQPVVHLGTGEIRSLEGLARWQHPRLGAISPLTFIEIAEQSGEINSLGDWALRTACAQLNDWAERGLTDYHVAVNVSVHQLRQEDIVRRVVRLVDEAGVDPTKITIEVTESVLIDNSDLIAERMRALRSAGFAMAIDDFGTGYSSLGYLQRYEFDILKIDKSFVDPLVAPENQREREVVGAIISLAQGLGAVTVAEGIEEQSQLDVLAELGCDYGQGYFLFRPAEVDQCTEILVSDQQSRQAVR